MTASRKAPQLEAALRRQGADVVTAPTTGGDEPASPAALQLMTDAVIALAPDYVVASTGVGMRLWVGAAREGGRIDDLGATFQRASVAARGAKAVGALRELGVAPAFVAPRELDIDVAEWLRVRVRAGQSVVVQIPGQPTSAFDALARAGARVVPVAPYRCVPPADPGPAQQLVRSLADGRVDVVTFTSPGAVSGLMDIAGDLGLAHATLSVLATGRPAVAVVGLATATACERHGIPVSVMPDRPRSGNLVRSIAAWAARPDRETRPLPVRLDPDRRIALVAGRSVTLGAREFGVLSSLARRPGVACRLATIVTETWGVEAPDDPSGVKHQVARLRAKLDPEVTIETVRGVGYRLTGTR